MPYIISVHMRCCNTNLNVKHPRKETKSFVDGKFGNFSGKQLTSASFFVPLKSIYQHIVLGRFKCCHMYATLCLVAMYVVTCIVLCILTTQLHGQNKLRVVLPSVGKQWTLQFTWRVLSYL